MKIGTVSSVDNQIGTVKIIIDDENEIVTSPINLLESAGTVSVGDNVVYQMMSESKGMCFGRYYSEKNKKGG